MSARLTLITLVFLFCTSCALVTDTMFGELEILPANGWGMDVSYECYSLGAEKVDRLTCGQLSECIGQKAKGTPLEDPDMRKTYSKLVPRDRSRELLGNVSIPYAREKASKLGPQAIALFTAMEETRWVCIRKMGLTKYMSRT